MSHYTPTNDQMQALLQYASKRLGVSPDQLLNAAQSGDVSKLGQSMSPADAQTLQSFMQNNKQAQQFLQSPAVQQYIANLFNQDKS